MSELHSEQAWHRADAPGEARLCPSAYLPRLDVGFQQLPTRLLLPRFRAPTLPGPGLGAEDSTWSRSPSLTTVHPQTDTVLGEPSTCVAGVGCIHCLLRQREAVLGGRLPEQSTVLTLGAVASGLGPLPGASVFKGRLT